MRSLWRMLALRWLGGHGSEALSGESAILEGLLLAGDERPAFDVRPQLQVSRRAIMLPDPERRFDTEIRAEEALHSGVSGRYSR